ncbi:cytochrome C [Lysobacter sp. CFH 32150]|uniref:cytochrome C n=1 Tax=Lysobacter sp. CFH 32150 TaxID=2927128 RepID=UPI001FA79917|nr:cytochrome C [Lysobacter sp. CFH 32150]MCI4568779.1 cytochrome C [Lysobacter sp. CFH 32150]
MHATRFAIPALMLMTLAACQQAPQPIQPAAATTVPADADLVAQGEYLVKIGGCNDCHTPGYMDKAGDIPKDQWMIGNQLGFSGPWGTTYPANLRLKIADMDEATWLAYTADLHTRPMMPDFNVRAMKEQDRLAIFRFIKSLGPAGEAAPAYMPPGQKPAPPYIELVLPAAPPAEAPAAG